VQIFIGLCDMKAVRRQEATKGVLRCCPDLRHRIKERGPTMPRALPGFIDDGKTRMPALRIGGEAGRLMQRHGSRDDLDLARHHIADAGQGERIAAG
jgi:hypothetical protein